MRVKYDYVFKEKSILTASRVTTNHKERRTKPAGTGNRAAGLHASCRSELTSPPSIHPSIMADSSLSWWKLTFLRRKKSQPKVLYEIPADFISNSPSAQHASAPASGPGSPEDTHLDTRLERIVDKSTASKGRHMKVSHSGRFKEKKKVRATLTENPQMFSGEPARDENLRVGK
ncbi:hypothetical protein FQN60_004416%2C partial [Xyrichtys novacula]|uniref:Proline-rich protein 15-like protein A n=1 Tax=Xyrichtys novacula TaxID=13765 RepID=A0AAV1GU14_XYRNO|nr:hypothetical protein FQN60_004416%2C partial [Xyrichtys novacula]